MQILGQRTDYGVIFTLYSKYTECFVIKYAGRHGVFPLFVQWVSEGPSLDIRLPSHASFLAPTTHKAGCTLAEYQCPVSCGTSTHESLMHSRIGKYQVLAASSGSFLL
jgi:hypothetical protein